MHPLFIAVNAPEPPIQSNPIQSKGMDRSDGQYASSAHVRPIKRLFFGPQSFRIGIRTEGTSAPDRAIDQNTAATGSLRRY